MNITITRNNNHLTRRNFIKNSTISAAFLVTPLIFGANFLNDLFQDFPEDIIDQPIEFNTKMSGFFEGASYIYPSCYDKMKFEYGKLTSNGTPIVTKEYYKYKDEYYLLEDQVKFDGKMGWHQNSKTFSIIFDKRYITREFEKSATF